MSQALEYNARFIPTAEVACSFIPPERHFQQLLSRSNSLVLGPRGSGKTTLLKMLTVTALQNWSHPLAKRFAPEIAFNGAFVPADITWGRQVEAIEILSNYRHCDEAAFVLHTLRALVHAMREAVELAKKPAREHLSHLAIPLTDTQEERFVKIISQSLKIEPQLDSLLGVELAFEARLDEIFSGKDDHDFGVTSFASKVRFIVSAFNSVIGEDQRRWALLFDELEVAPTVIKSFLLSALRGFDERIIIKLALAPYMEDVGFDRAPTSPQTLHDYSTISLTYPNKDDATAFSSELFLATFGRARLPVTSLSSIFEKRSETGSFKSRGQNRKRRQRIPPEFVSLAERDSSFRSYIAQRHIFSSTYVFSEDNIARDIRKVLPIAVARDYYLKRFDENRVVWNRSRKSYSLYTGYPSIIDITEGNPRAIMTLVAPMIDDYRRAEGAGSSAYKISTIVQGQALRRVELLLTSLLQVVPLDLSGFRAKGLLEFVDYIGRAFEHRLLRGPFAPDYIGTFGLDERVSPALVGAVGRALNAGALIHVPHPDSGPDSLLRGLRGQRFRISYSLAPRYRLLLTVGDQTSLSNLVDAKWSRLKDSQQSLFDLDATDDHS